MKKFQLNKIILYTHLTFLCIVLISSLFITYFEIKEREDSVILSTAGRNRMLSQQIAFYAEQAADGDEFSKNKLQVIIKLHKDSLYVIKNGGVVPDLKPEKIIPKAPQEILSTIEKAETFGQEYERNAMIIAVEPAFIESVKGDKKEKERNSAVSDALVYVENNAPEMLVKDDNVLKLYSIESTHNQKTSSVVFFLLFLTNLLVILVGAWLSIFFTRKSEESKLLSKSILENMGEGLVVVNKDRKIIEMNSVAGELLGINPDTSIGKLYNDMLPAVNAKGEIIKESERPIQIVFQNGKRYSNSIFGSTLLYARKNKTFFPASVLISPVILKNETIAVVEIFRDITLDKKIDQAKSEFISLASHQLKTPPTAVKLLTERLLSGKIGELNKKQYEYVSDIRFSNQRMIDLVNALLSVSRIELGGFTVQTIKKDICTILQNSIDELEPIIKTKKLRVKVAYQEKNVVLPIDETLFLIVINNIITNAVRYTKNGGEIKIELKKVLKGETLGKKILRKDYYVVCVADNGYGVPEDQKSKLFDKFFRANNVKEKQTDGTGLGLYIVKSILDISGGLLWFISQENKGSTFYVAIPITGMKAKNKTL